MLEVSRIPLYRDEGRVDVLDHGDRGVFDLAQAAVSDPQRHEHIPEDASVEADVFEESHFLVGVPYLADRLLHRRGLEGVLLEDGFLAKQEGHALVHRESAVVRRDEVHVGVEEGVFVLAPIVVQGFLVAQEALALVEVLGEHRPLRDHLGSF